MRRVSGLILAVALSASCSGQLLSQRVASPNPAPQAGPRPAALSSSLPTIPAKLAMKFTDISAEAGLTTVPHTRTDRRYVLDTMSGGGVALLDCDNDGKLDIAVINDSTIDQYLKG